MEKNDGIVLLPSWVLIKVVEVVLKIGIFTRKIMMNNVPLLGLLLLSLGGFVMLLLSPYEPILVKKILQG